MQVQNDQLEQYIKSNCFCESDLTDQTQLREDLGVDSLRMVELIVFIEESYGIELNDADLDMSKFNTVGDLRRMIEGYLK